MSVQHIAMREAFGQALLELGRDNPRLVVLDADVSSSTKTLDFGTQYPDRFFNLGVAEANMADIAAGMAACGLRPVISTFAIFLSLKCTEQIRSTICYNHLPVVLAGGYAGVSDSFDGASHQSLADLAIMRAIPNLTVTVPGDGAEVGPCLRQALDREGPTYIRLSRNPTPILFDRAAPFETGKIRVLKRGRDITLAVCGVPTYMAMEAAERLEQEGISADLLEVSTIKPMDEAALIESVSRTNRILTIEEHTVRGGLGSAISEVLARLHPVKTDFVGIEDCFTETGPYAELLNAYGISTEQIVLKARMLVDTKKS